MSIDSDLGMKFDDLRTCIEARLSQQTIIAISSAEHGDGKSLVASGLADSLAADGTRVALVHFGISTPGSRDPLHARSSSGVYHFSLICSEESPPTQWAPAFSWLRSHFSYTILDSLPVVEGSSGTRIANSADALFVAVRLGRRASAKDAFAARILQGVAVGEVVSVSPMYIDAFREEREANPIVASLLDLNVAQPERDPNLAIRL